MCRLSLWSASRAAQYSQAHAAMSGFPGPVGWIVPGMPAGKAIQPMRSSRRGERFLGFTRNQSFAQSAESAESPASGWIVGVVGGVMSRAMNPTAASQAEPSAWIRYRNGATRAVPLDRLRLPVFEESVPWRKLRS
jgi:hypothetical protein